MLKLPQKAVRGLEKAMRPDRKWFARNPSRSYRARPCVAGELLERMDGQLKNGHSRWTLIRQIEAGFRVRTFIHTPNFAVPLDSDESIGALFDGALTGGGFMWAPPKHFRPTGLDCSSLVHLLEHTSGGVQ
jgi:hypothetical protein